MGRLIFRSTGKRQFSISLEEKYIDYFRKQPNRSKFIQELIEKAMQEEKIKEKTEEKETEIDLKDYPLSEDEIQFAAASRLEQPLEWDFTFYNKTIPRADERSTYIFYWYQAFSCRPEGRQIWDKLIDHVAKKCPEAKEFPKVLHITFDESKTSPCVINELDKLLGKLFIVANAIWVKKWKARYNKIVVADLTLESVCSTLGRPNERDFTIKQIADILGLPYQQVYKIAPLLIKEGYTIEDKKK